MKTLWTLWAGPDPDLGRRLRAGRRRLGLTQTQVAGKLGRTTSTVCMWEKGRRPISAGDLVSYGAIIHATLADLIGDDHPGALLDSTSLTEM